jgi:hypothetical protein
MSWPRDGVEEGNTNDALAGVCFATAPEEACEWFLRELDGSVERERSAWAVRRASHSDLELVEEPLLERTNDGDWPARARAEVPPPLPVGARVVPSEPARTRNPLL